MSQPLSQKIPQITLLFALNYDNPRISPKRKKPLKNQDLRPFFKGSRLLFTSSSVLLLLRCSCLLMCGFHLSIYVIFIEINGFHKDRQLLLISGSPNLLLWGKNLIIIYLIIPPFITVWWNLSLSLGDFFLPPNLCPSTEITANNGFSL